MDMDLDVGGETIGAVIPIIPAHKKYLPSLLRNIQMMDRQFDSVVVVASGFSRKQFLSLRHASDFAREFQVKFLRVGPGSAGKNRNIGWANIDTKYICFLDADDSYPLDRTRIIEKIMVTHSLDALVHAFSELNDTTEMEPKRHEDFVLVRERELFHATFDGKPRERDREIAEPNWESTIKTDAVDGFAVHHGHLTIRRDLPRDLRFHEYTEHRNEDSVFVRDLVWRGLRTGALSWSLSNYRPASSGHIKTLKYLRNETISFLHNLAKNFSQLLSPSNRSSH